VELVDDVVLDDVLVEDVVLVDELELLDEVAPPNPPKPPSPPDPPLPPEPPALSTGSPEVRLERPHAPSAAKPTKEVKSRVKRRSMAAHGNGDFAVFHQ
jgi:hypothetical protein